MRDPVPLEVSLAIHVNGKHAIDVRMSPGRVKELVVGHLICEGLIEVPGDIKTFARGSGWARVEIRTARPKIAASTTRFGARSLDGHGMLAIKGFKALESKVKASPSQVLAALDHVGSSCTHRLTGGVHTCGLFQLPDEGGLPVMASLCDDIGRHNAFDKAVGAALLEGFDLGRCMAALTGRTNSTIVAKCYGAGIPILASRGATTALAVKLARRVGVTLIGFAREERMNIYANDQRIVQQPDCAHASGQAGLGS